MWNFRRAAWVGGVMMGVVFAGVMAGPVKGLVEVSFGNGPVEDQDWPVGTVGVGNLGSRVGMAAGPNGGLVTFAYRGDVGALQEALEEFAKIRSEGKSVVVREGREYLYWLRGQGGRGGGGGEAGRLICMRIGR